jgi:hypothetical protein
MKYPVGAWLNRGLPASQALAARRTPAVTSIWPMSATTVASSHAT